MARTEGRPRSAPVPNSPPVATRRVFVTGGAGYIGSVLSQQLLEHGHQVTVFDRLFFGVDSLGPLRSHPRFRLVQGDIRDDLLLQKTLPDHDTVIHLAAIVGDPACAAAADLASDVNLNASAPLAALAKRSGVERFVFASTCSVYGANQGMLSEESPVNPLSLYAKTRLLGEQRIHAQMDDGFRPVILRFGTLYGLSPRMRFDLVVNYLTLKVLREKEISIFGGDQWRPFLHVADAAKAVTFAMEAPLAVAGGRIFNVGANAHNYQLKSLGPIFQDLVPQAQVRIIPELDDKRSYRVAFDRISRELGFAPDRTLEGGIREILDALEAGLISDVDDARYYNHRVIGDGTAQ
jgi:nucleoside-diphosphate-sugar epimerase